MKAMSRPCRLVLYEGQKHGFFNPRGDNENYWKTLGEVEKFLAARGYLKAP